MPLNQTNAAGSCMAHVDDRSNWRPEHIQMTQGHDEGRRHLLAQKYIYLSPISKITVHNFLINTTTKKKKTTTNKSQNESKAQFMKLYQFTLAFS